MRVYLEDRGRSSPYSLGSLHLVLVVRDLLLRPLQLLVLILHVALSLGDCFGLLANIRQRLCRSQATKRAIAS